MFTDEAYIYVGSSDDTLNLKIPYPSEGNASFKETVMCVQERNANGIMVSQQLGNPVINQVIGWTIIKAEVWWGINKFFSLNGNVFYCKYFDHNIGEWKIKQFRRTPTECNPVMVQKETGAAKYYTGASFAIESVGD